MADPQSDWPLYTEMDAFRLYVRTGRRVPAHRLVQVKFNSNHDPKDGRFTFKNSAGGSAGMSTSPKAPQRPGQEDPRIVADARQSQRRRWANDPRNPANQDRYVVQRGDTLTHIAATRIGVTAGDVAWLNGLAPDAVIHPGDQLVLPKQDYLDAGKRGADAASAISLYEATHGGRLPPDVAHPPSVAEQMLGPGTHEVTKNGYTFTLDRDENPRMVVGAITLNPDQKRSEKNQLLAGGSDRLPTDQGGHYIAREFNGPTDAYNHFAQDAHFNRSGWRKLELQWKRFTSQGRVGQGRDIAAVPKRLQKAQNNQCDVLCGWA